MFLAFTTETNTLKLQSPLYEFDLAHTCLLLSLSHLAVLISAILLERPLNFRDKRRSVTSKLQVSKMPFFPPCLGSAFPHDSEKAFDLKT